MILAVMLLATMQVAPLQEPTPEEVVVTGSRLRRAQYGMSVNRITGAIRCRISQSSGDPAIDRAVCDIGRHCARTARRTREAIEACVEERRRAFIATYVPQRD